MPTHLEPDFPPAAPPAAEELPRALLYSTSARIGGTGLDVSALEGARAAAEGGFLYRVIGYANQQNVIPASKVRSLAWHPVRLLSGLGSERYYGAKKHYVDWIAAREVRRGRCDFLHTWSGDGLRSLAEARRRGIPSVMDIPTWHRNKGRVKPFVTRTEREAAALTGWAGWAHRLRVSRQEMLMEYELATLLLMPSRCSAQTFLDAGVPPERLHYAGRGVDVHRYRPGTPPEKFRVIFTGALIRRKGVHLLLEAWRKLALKDAELVLAGAVHPEIKNELGGFPEGSVRVAGFVGNVAELLASGAVFAFPSECEGFAKATLEAAACGLPLIATRESGDAIVDGETGRLIPANNVEALIEALREAAENRDRFAAMGRNARALVESRFTWEHFRARILRAYARAMKMNGRPLS